MPFGHPFSRPGWLDPPESWYSVGVWGMVGSWMVALGLMAPPAAAPLGQVRSWALFYGEKAPEALLSAPDLLVLEPDQPWGTMLWRRPGQKVVGYLSLGEVHDGRAYAKEVKASGAVVEPNPDWPGAKRVDPRHPAWSRLVVDTLAPSILAKGYDGLFLDTLDVGGFLERERGKAGARLAMAQLIRALHARFPTALLIANGGLDLLPEAGPSLSALAVESVGTAYQFTPQRRYAWRPGPEAEARAAELGGQAKAAGLPLLVIEYVDPTDPLGRAKAANQVRSWGFVPFVTDIGLARLDPTP